jgi:hyperosmotically inducible protein
LPPKVERKQERNAGDRLAGVKAIVVEMNVRLHHTDVHTDADIARAVRTILHWTVGLSEESLKVQVEKKWLRLSGEIDSAYQSHVATRTVSRMRGVTGVADMIRIGGEAAAQDIGEQISQPLQRGPGALTCGPRDLIW